MRGLARGVIGAGACVAARWIGSAFRQNDGGPGGGAECLCEFKGVPLSGKNFLAVAPIEEGRVNWNRGEGASRLSAALFLCRRSTLYCPNIAVGIKFLLGLGGWGAGAGCFSVGRA